MTRLPTGTPTRPVFHPGMSWPSVNTLGGEVGSEEFGQLSLNTLPVRQIEPTYLTTIDSPAFTGAPVPLISVVTTSLVGGEVLGIVIAGPVAGEELIFGRAPPPSVICVPDAPWVGVNAWSTSITQTRVSVGSTPIWELPCAP